MVKSRNKPSSYAASTIFDEYEYQRYREYDLERRLDESNFDYFCDGFLSICCILCYTHGGCCDAGCAGVDCCAPCVC